MKHLFFLLALIGALSVWAQLQDKKPAARRIVTIEHAAYIPANLDECFRQIDRAWQQKRSSIPVDENLFCSSEHARTGSWIRNNWLVDGGRLTTYFHGLGIRHADDMSDIILRSYHRYLNKRDIDISKQVQNFRNTEHNVVAVSKAS